ncbi:MAG TPA: acyl-CoA synthetase [Kineosporiaceae bacterium]
MALTIADLVEHAVDAFPERLAVCCEDQELTYAELEARANRLAHFLAARGIGVGDHVGMFAVNSVEAILTLVAVYKLRAVVVNVNYRYVADEVRYLLRDADVKVLVHDAALAGVVATVRPDVPTLRGLVVIGAEPGDHDGEGDTWSFEGALAGESGERDFGPRSGDDHYMIYTGGTTGYPKGVIWRHEDVWRTLGGGIDFFTGTPLTGEWAQSEYGRQTGGMVRMCLAPLIHGNAQWAAFMAFFTGDTVVLLPHFDPHQVWRVVERRKVNVIVLIGDAMGRPIVEALAEGGYDTSSVFAVSTSAALFSPAVQAEFAARLPNAMITESIGSSETGFAGIGVLSAESRRREGPRVTPGPDTVVLDENDRPVQPGEIGRLARGGYVPIGYYKDPVKTAAMFVEVDGTRYVLPGDFARLEEDGTLTLLGRGNTCVNTGGEKVYPEEVEAVLKGHPDILDALVIGLADERLGQSVAALIQPRPGHSLDHADVDAHLRRHLAGYKVPRTVWTVDSIGRLPSGKPNYGWAREYAAGHDPEGLTATSGTDR